MSNYRVQPKNGGAGNAFGAAVVLLAAGAIIWYFFLGGLQNQAAAGLEDTYRQVANDAVAQYDIARRNGSAMDACVHAGLVAAAYLQAKDENSYQQWKRTESSDCRSAGLPR